MKYLCLLTFFLPYSAIAQFGIELNGGLNMHIGPVGTSYYYEKGSKPAEVYNIKCGVYRKRVEYGAAFERGRWVYSKDISGHHFYPPLKPGTDSYNSLYTFCNYNFINKKLFLSTGVNTGFVKLSNQGNEVWMNRYNRIEGDGSLPASDGVFFGLSTSLGYNISPKIRVKLNLEGKYISMQVDDAFAASRGSLRSEDFAMLYFPCTIGVAFHNFIKKREQPNYYKFPKL